MIGNLLTLVSALGAFALGTVFLQNVLDRRARAWVRSAQTQPADNELS